MCGIVWILGSVCVVCVGDIVQCAGCEMFHTSARAPQSRGSTVIVNGVQSVH